MYGKKYGCIKATRMRLDQPLLSGGRDGRDVHVAASSIRLTRNSRVHMPLRWFHRRRECYARTSRSSVRDKSEPQCLIFTFARAAGIWRSQPAYVATAGLIEMDRWNRRCAGP